MIKRQNQQPATVRPGASVPFCATPAGQPPALEEWVNRGVWTDRMLAALRSGVKGGRWHTLYDKVCASATLLHAALTVVVRGGAAGVDRQSTIQFANRSGPELGCAKLTIDKSGRSSRIRYTAERD